MENENIREAQSIQVPAPVPGLFPITRWTLIITARDFDSPSAQQALETLCRAYWRPLYVYLRADNVTAEDAADGVQGLFETLLRRDFLSNVGPERGRFRSFMLAALKNHLADQRAKSQAGKRGGGMVPLSLEALREEEAGFDPAHADLPDRAFERRWARQVLQEAEDAVRANYLADGRERLFERLYAYLTEEASDATYADIARELAMNAPAVRKAALTLRVRFGQQVRALVRDTVDNPDETEDEVSRLFMALQG